MDKTTPLHLQEIFFSSKDPEVSRAISKLVREGQLQKIAPKIYTKNFDSNPSQRFSF